MKKLIKLFLLCSIIFATSIFCINVNSVSATQISIEPDLRTTSTLPSEYDLRDYINIDVENQSPYGICYAYASLTSLETYLALHYGEYYDFSELHFALSLYLQEGYYTSVDDALNDGGNFAHFALHTQKDNAIVLEDEMPMSKYKNLSEATRYSTMVTDFNNINENFYLLAKVNDTKTFTQIVGNKSQYSSTELTTFRNSVKNHIMQYGSLTAGIHSSSDFEYSTVNYKITDNSLVTNSKTINDSINHLISIVGWNDNYDANGTWANKGAYLCLNSWGTSFGENGYFYVSYDDYFIESTIQGVVNATLSTTNNKISTIKNYQDNTFIVTHTLSGSSGVYFANIFDTSAYLGESITHIDTFAKGDNIKYYIRFFQNKDSALSGLNTVTVMNLVNSIKVDEYSLYTKNQLSSPLSISGNYMVVIAEIINPAKTYTLGGYSNLNLGIEPTYLSYYLSNFSTSNVWEPDVNQGEMDLTLPMILHTNKQYIQPSSFTSEVESFINSKYIKNNAIFYNKSIKLNLINSNLSNEDLSNITITKLYTNSFVDVSTNFDMTLNSATSLTITMTSDVNSSFKAGNYLITIPCGDTLIYRVIEVQDVVAYPITYHLNGGTATNPSVYTNKHTSLALSNPVKDGYTFLGWYTDSDLTQSFNLNTLPYTSLNLYAKYDFATPTISSKTNDISITYYEGLNVVIGVNATHALLNEYNTLSYQWYMRKSLTDEFTIISGATSSILTLYDVNDTGYYVCDISITITDPSVTDTTVIKTLDFNAGNQIVVNIKPFIYDMSKAVWNYTDAIAYNNTTHVIEVINLPTGVSINYSGNEASEIGSYLAHAELVYNNMDGNAIANPITDLNWEIRKAKIVITIDDITSQEVLSKEDLDFTYTSTIECEYLPSDIITEQDKINYLELTYELVDTAQPYVKTITAKTKSFDIYDITIIDAKYCVVIYNLTYNNITTTSVDGFVVDCKFSAKTTLINDITSTLLKEQNLTLVESYDISYSYLQTDDTVTINIPLSRTQLLNNLSVYMLKDGKLVKVENVTLTTQGLTITSNEQNATYIIVQEDYSHNTNTQILIVISIIGVYIILCVYAIVSAIKHKRQF